MMDLTIFEFRDKLLKCVENSEFVIYGFTQQSATVHELYSIDDQNVLVRFTFAKEESQKIPIIKLFDWYTAGKIEFFTQLKFQ